MARPRRRRYELRSPALNAELEALVGRALAEAGRDAEAPGADFARQLVVSALRLVEDGTDEGDLKLLNAALKELRHALRVFAPYAHVRKVSVFGSARTLPEHPDWRQAYAFAERMVQEGWMVITGAGDGIMSAAQGGAGVTWSTTCGTGVEQQGALEITAPTDPGTCTVTATSTLDPSESATATVTIRAE